MLVVYWTEIEEVDIVMECMLKDRDLELDW